MAVKWAIVNGSFQSGTTWNDGVAPASGDTCYLNGHTLSLTTLNIDIGDGLISNAPNEDYNIVTGGYFSYTLAGSSSPQYTLVCNIEVASGTLFQINGAYRAGGIFTYNGNISVNAGCVAFGLYMGIYNMSTTIFGWTQTGNITGSGTFIELTGNPFGTYRGLSILNGNISINTISIGTAFPSATINGNLTLSNTLSNISTLTLNGALTTIGNAVFTGTTLHINGSIYYSSNDNSTGVRVSTLDILNPDSFRWKDTVGSNPFIIVTRADIQDETNYPNEDRVVQGTDYAYNQLHGRFVVDYPPETVVLQGYVYDNGYKTGSMSAQAQVGCVTKEDVREGVPLIGMYEDGQQVVGTIVIPAEEDVREGVVFDNGSVGTLIVQGGGDRLRIADFGYYTNAQSDTYIVDLTEQDKPKFAVAEERVLIEMFPELDLDNIPEKYFDDLFVKFLKYRLIVEYYRTAGINSTFTPSEPTTEIVNYRNVNCEIWMNIANTYLKAWGAKYPNSIKKQRILL